ncbi:MAG: PTS sorbitol transporter subunit IIC [Dorea sp.]|nr:PTS sorbitol transporter subunit IIC [Dorea sp.]
MEFLVSLANGLTGIVSAGAENLVGLITGVLPNVLILLTLINALVALVGEEKVMSAARRITRFRILRYTVIPFMGLFFFTNPMCYTIGRFVDEDCKPAVIDSLFSFAHPITGIFPHANSGELFVWLGISAGLTTLDVSATPLAIRYFLVGIIVMFLRGNITEFVTKAMLGRESAKKKEEN